MFLKNGFRLLIIAAIYIPMLGCAKTYYDQEMSKAFSFYNVNRNKFKIKFPDLSENNKTIMGIDSDSNGIRDDLEIWLDMNYSDLEIREVARKYLKSIEKETKTVIPVDVQALLDDPKLSYIRDDLKMSEKGIDDAINCLIFLERKKKLKHDDNFISDLGRMFFNTSLRKELEIKIGLATSSIHVEPSRPNEESCKAD